MTRKQYSKSQIRDLLENISYAGEFITKKSNVFENDDKIFVDNKLALIKFNDQWTPHLKILLKHIVLPKVTVDMGAVKFVVNGADIMRPGITNIEDFEKDKLIVIIDETHGKPLAVGKALFSSEEMRNESKGKVIKNLHYVGDDFWNLY